MSTVSNKKRASEYNHLNKDEYNALIEKQERHNDNNDSSSNNTFQRANDAQMQGRRIMTVNRSKIQLNIPSATTAITNESSSSSTTSNTTINPFANVRLSAVSGSSLSESSRTPPPSGTSSTTTGMFGNHSGRIPPPSASITAVATNSLNHQQQQQQPPQLTASELLNTTIRARNTVNQQFKQQMMMAGRPSRRQSGSSTSVPLLKDSIELFLAYHQHIDTEHESQSIRITSNSSNISGSTGSSRTEPPPLAASTTTTTTAVVQAPASVPPPSSTTTNLFGNFFTGPTAVATVVNSNNFSASNKSENTNDGDDNEGVGPTDDDNPNNPNDQIQPAHEPDWNTIGVYEKVVFYCVKDLTNNANNKTMEKFCSGTLQIQSHTVENNLSRMIVRTNQGIKVAINIRLTTNMPLQLSIRPHPKQQGMTIGNIHFMGLNDLSRGMESFAIKCNGTVAKKLHAQLQQLTQ